MMRMMATRSWAPLWARRRGDVLLDCVNALGAMPVVTNAVPSIVLSLYETSRVGGGIVGLVTRVAAHITLGVISSNCGILAAIAAHTVFNVVMVRVNPASMLDATQTMYTRRDLTRNGGAVVEDLCMADCKTKKVAIQDGFKITAKPEAKCDPGFGARAMWGVKGYYADINRTCDHNEMVSLAARVGKKLPQHEQGVQEEVEAEWIKLARTVIPVFERHVKPTRNPIPISEWVKTFPPKKRDMYIRLDEEGAECPKPSRMCASSFVKKELVLREEARECLVKDPRMIQGCPPELSLHTGPYIRRAAKRLRRDMKPKHWEPESLKQGRHFVYTCGMTMGGVGGALSKGIAMIERMCSGGEKVVVLEDDQSRFDLHITGPAFGFLDRLYKHTLPRHVRRALRRTDKSKGRTTLGCKYSIPYTMQSGWPDTSYGDTACNEGMKLYIHGIGRKWVSIVCGDDSVTVTTDKEIERLGGAEGIVAAYARLGMEVEVSVRTNPDLAEFCSARFYMARDRYIMMPKPGKLFARLGWDMVDRSKDNQKAWARGVVATLKHYGKVDPLMLAAALSLEEQLGIGKIIVQQDDQYKHKLTTCHTPDRSDVYYYYALHYDLAAGDVDALEKRLRGGLLSIGTITSDPTLEHMANVDA